VVVTQAWPSNSCSARRLARARRAWVANAPEAHEGVAQQVGAGAIGDAGRPQIAVHQQLLRGVHFRSASLKEEAADGVRWNAGELMGWGPRVRGGNPRRPHHPMGYMFAARAGIPARPKRRFQRIPTARSQGESERRGFPSLAASARVTGFAGRSALSRCRMLRTDFATWLRRCLRIRFLFRSTARISLSRADECLPRRHHGRSPCLRSRPRQRSPSSVILSESGLRLREA
jgi:hypothetical protein